MSKVIFQKAKTEDIPRFIEIEKKNNSKIYSAMTTEKEWQEEMAKENEIIYAILAEGKIIGDASYGIKDNGTAYISGLCIDQNFQGQGVGKKAIEFILNKLGDFKRIELVTHPENENAIKIYSSLGFSTEKQIENYYGDGEPRILMVKINYENNSHR